MSAERIKIGGKSYRRFIQPPHKVNDGMPRCIACGQIDEPEWHDDDICIQVRTGDYKRAKLRLNLRADSGYSSTTDCMVSVNQWKAINAIIEEGAA